LEGMEPTERLLGIFQGLRVKKEGRPPRGRSGNGAFSGFGQTASVRLRRVWRLMELGAKWRSSGLRSFVVEMVQDSTDDARLGDEGEDLHLGPALATGQGVDLVVAVDELGPSSGQSAWGRGRPLVQLSL